MNWHLQSIATTLEALQSQPETGLSQTEADARLTQYGRNELVACFHALRDNPEVAAELGRNAREYVKDLNWDRIARRITTLLQEFATPAPMPNQLEKQTL